MGLLCLFSRRTCAGNSTFSGMEALITATESFHHSFSLVCDVPGRCALHADAPLSDRKKCHSSSFSSTFHQLRVQDQFYLLLFVIVVSPDGENKTVRGSGAAFRQHGRAPRRGVECLLSQGFIQFSCPFRKTRRSVLHLERKTNKNLSSDLWSPARCPDRGGKTQDVQIHSGHCEKASVSELFLSQPTRKDIYSV